MDYLLPEFQKDSGITVKLIAQGTGAAIKTASDGNADVVLVHDRAAEDEFVSSGNGLKRIEVMYNYFVIVGPKNDPVGIKAKVGRCASLSQKRGGLLFLTILEFLK